MHMMAMRYKAAAAVALAAVAVAAAGALIAFGDISYRMQDGKTISIKGRWFAFHTSRTFLAGTALACVCQDSKVLMAVIMR